LAEQLKIDRQLEAAGWLVNDHIIRKTP